jgi:hypothetical protein
MSFVAPGGGVVYSQLNTIDEPRRVIRTLADRREWGRDARRRGAFCISDT